MSYKDAILELIDAGMSYREIALKLGCSKSTVSYHASNVHGVKFNKSNIGDYNWEEIARFYYSGKTYSECCKKFNITRNSLTRAASLGYIVPRTGKKPLNKLKNPCNVKRRVISDNLVPYVCSWCGLVDSWNNKPLVLHLDHINGINTDNRVENLRFLCPNCHSQTETYSGRNIGNK